MDVRLGVSGQFCGWGDHHSSRLLRACAFDDSDILFQIQVSSLEELDACATHALSSSGCRLETLCARHDMDFDFSHSSTSAHMRAIALYAIQALNQVGFCKQVCELPGMPSCLFNAVIGHSQGLVNAIATSASVGQESFTFLSR